MKLRSVFDVIAHWAADLLRKTVRDLSGAVASCKETGDVKEVVLLHARTLTAVLGMLTSQSHFGKL